MGRVHGMPIHFAHCLTVASGHEGLSLSAPWFVFFHRPPITVPWSQVEAVEPSGDSGKVRVRLRADGDGDGPAEFMLMGRAGRMAASAFDRRGNSAA